MSSTVVVFGNAKKTVQVNPSTTMKDIVVEACKEFGVDSMLYRLRYKRKLLPLSELWRFANLPNRCQLELVKSQAVGPQNVKVAVNISAVEKRVMGTFPSTITLWGILRQVEDKEDVGTLTRLEGRAKGEKKKFFGKKKDGPLEYMIPVVSVLNKQHADLDTLGTTTLDSLGLHGGSVLLRVDHKLSGRSMEDVLPVLRDTDAQAEAIAASTEESLGQKKARLEASKQQAEEKKRQRIEEQEEKKQLAEAEKKTKTTVAPTQGFSTRQPFISDTRRRAHLEETGGVFGGARMGAPRSIFDEGPAHSMFVPANAEEVLTGKKEEIPPDSMEAMLKQLQGDASARITGEKGAPLQLNEMLPALPPEKVKEMEEQKSIAEAKMRDGKVSKGRPKFIALDREVKVFAPNDIQMDPSTLPDNFFVPTKDDVRKLLISERKKQETPDVLMTKALREKEKKRKQRKYRKTLLRFVFPDRYSVTAEFAPGESIRTVKKFLKEFVLPEEEEAKFYLYITPPVHRFEDDNARLREFHLMPAAIIYFSWEDRDRSLPHIRTSLLEKASDWHPDKVKVPEGKGGESTLSAAKRAAQERALKGDGGKGRSKKDDAKLLRLLGKK